MTRPRWWRTRGVTVHLGDCIDVMRSLPDASVDAIVTDPPYGLGFMGHGWDDLPPGLPWAQECLRVLKPGGHLLAFGGTRTWHRLAVAVEDAGFEMRDSIAWLYSQGFPKSHDISKAIDRAAGVEREPGVPGPYSGRRPRAEVTAVSAYADGVGDYGSSLITEPATAEAQQWNGWGTALKPAFEPIVVGRKPLVSTVAANVLTHGVGGLNIDACRTATSDADKAAINAKRAGMDPDTYERAPGVALNLSVNPLALKPAQAHDGGRWPTNVLMDGDSADLLDTDSEPSTSRVGRPRASAEGGDGWRMTATGTEHADSGGPSRYFPVFRYQAKAPARERPSYLGPDGERVAHSTVKPLDLMRWLVRLVTPPGGLVLDPFAGSGTTVEACLSEGFGCAAIESDEKYLPLIWQRIERATAPTEVSA